jgi:L-arabinokinase
VRSSVPRWLFEATAVPGIGVVGLECDTGAVQIDSLHLDEEQTVRRAEKFMAGFDARVEAEARALEAEDAALVLADVPPLGMAAAKAGGRPAVLLGNFTWDWIYDAYPGGSTVAAAIGRVYAETDLALRLPLHGGFGPCRRIRDLPFIARRSFRDPDEVRRALGLPRDRPLALVSFGGFGVARLDLEQLARTRGIGIVMTGSTPFRGSTLSAVGPVGALAPLDEPAMRARGFRYEDVVKAVDAVVSKPGYGIIAECAANGAALLYTSRGRFAEYDVLVAGMPRVLRTRFIDHQTLYSGDWGPALEQLLAQPPPPETADVSGADVTADLLLGMI